MCYMDVFQNFYEAAVQIINKIYNNVILDNLFYFV